MSSSRGGIRVYSIGSYFATHVITASDGEDITMKIMSLSQQRYHAICILSANGIISSVTLRHSTSFGGTLTHKGMFRLISLTGTFLPTEEGLPNSRCGGMSVVFASPDGQLMGGELAGLLVAGGPMQVVVASFIPDPYRQDVVEHVPTTSPTPDVFQLNNNTAAFQVNNNIAAFSNDQGSMDSSRDDEAPLPESSPTISDA